MEDSIFTKIIKGELPCHKIYEDERVIAFLDIHPDVPAHTLVVPKHQVDHIWDLSDTDYAALMTAVKKISNHLRSKTKKTRVGVKIEGFDVPHAHVHLLPVDSGEEFKQYGNPDAQPNHAALSALAESLRLQ